MNKKQRQRLKEQEPVEIEINRLSHEGRGIGTHDGKTVFVSGALPGEKVLARITLVRTRLEEADAVEILTPSPDRVEPPCPHFGVCGGCSLQHMAPAAQIAFKQQVLAEHFRHFGGLEPEVWLPPLVHDTPDYRRKARLGVKYVIKKDSLLVGFRERNSNFLAELSTCRVLDRRIGESLNDLRELINGLQGRDVIPQIEVAAGDDEVALNFRHLAPLSDADREALSGFCQARGWHLYLQPGNYSTVHKVVPAQGADRIHYSLPGFNLRMAFHPVDFTQVNDSINRQMLSLAMEMLNPQRHERILDLFCGLGNFTLPLATLAGHVIGVEGDAAMVERGYENARANGITNVEFYAQDLTADFSGQPWASQGFDALLIDPPRSGALEIVQYLPKFGAKRIVYVSCNPATLARDAGELAKSGYKLKKAGVMDMFTHTAHVESIALFEKG